MLPGAPSRLNLRGRLFYLLILLHFERLNIFESNDAVLIDELEIIRNAAVVGF